MKAFDRKQFSQTISKIEARDPEAIKLLAKLFQPDSFKKTACFTGPAGVGKSSLLSELLALGAKEGGSACWLACDPSSPVSGGSVLGDRIRLSGSAVADNIYIRSLSTRGTAAFTPAIRDIEVFAESSFDRVWVETAGTGQTQSEVGGLSLLTVLILQPETGDEVQWMKSGLREKADLYLINKSDLHGAEFMQHSLVEMGAPKENVLCVSAKTKAGLKEALERIQSLQLEFSNSKERLLKLHQSLAESLFFESSYRRLKQTFKSEEQKWLKNPYVAASDRSEGSK